MKHPANREGFGKVDFHKGSGWSKFEHTSKSDDEQLKLLPSVKPVIEKGEYLGATKPNSNEARKKHIAAYHYFEANVELNGKNKYVGVTVIEDNQGNKFYNLVKDPDVVYERKSKAAQVAQDFENWDKSRFGDATDGTLEISARQYPSNVKRMNTLFNSLNALRRLAGMPAVVMDDSWITVHPNGEGTTGRHVLVGEGGG